jgi:hypothetical protein
VEINAESGYGADKPERNIRITNCPGIPYMEELALIASDIFM